MEGLTRNVYLFARFVTRWNFSAFEWWRGKDSEGASSHSRKAMRPRCAALQPSLLSWAAVSPPPPDGSPSSHAVVRRQALTRSQICFSF